MRCDDSRDRATGRAAVAVRPALDSSDAEFLAGFARRRGDPGVARLWPGQPRPPSPWRPCARGCCLELRADAGGLPPGLAGAWLRWLVATFLESRAVTGVARVPVRGGRVEVVVADRDGVFEGEVDPPLGWSS